MTTATAALPPRHRDPAGLLRRIFIRVGILPFFLILALLVFSSVSGNFLTGANMINVTRQSVYLILVALGQMIVLVTGGFDLAVGTTIALTSVVTATAMTTLATGSTIGVFGIIGLGIGAGLLTSLGIGLVNGFGVAYLGVSPFIMTLGVQSVGMGLALYLTGGVPISGLPPEFSDSFGFGRMLGIPVPIMVAMAAIAVIWLFVGQTRLGKEIYAVGGNARAAVLSGINVGRTLVIAYALCAILTSISGILLTARVESGEANLGATIALESIAACVIGGVSLHGGIGRVGNVILGAFFIVLMQNGMNLAKLGSYVQMILLGGLLILAVIADHFRYRLILGK
ncbi:ABC transporter permease [Telmatospirillum siberiense]|uniref:ABC transporter permease n=1 Tax=Telmatospirillum siberiense TaxID=382514 RepID=A0A2N3PR54_9PROT|nr:ABC transporter permease [Telmatospirillum siberiense]PKU22862.1 ABC transporter permease [Telmatospirillum siberiense]